MYIFDFIRQSLCIPFFCFSPPQLSSLSKLVYYENLEGKYRRAWFYEGDSTGMARKK